MQSSSTISPQSRSGPQQQQELTARALLDLCEQVYNSFNAAQHTLDTHLHNSLQHQANRLTEDETCFVQEVSGSRDGPNTRQHSAVLVRF